MLKVSLNRLKPQAEEIIAEEQVGFREPPFEVGINFMSCNSYIRVYLYFALW